MHRKVCLPLLALAALLLAPSAAQAVTLKISGECAGCAPATPAGPGLAFTRIAQVVEVSGFTEPTMSMTAHVVTPAGTAEIQGCRGILQGETALLYPTYRGNGDYTLIVRTWTKPPGSNDFFPGCDGTPREDAMSYTITAAASAAAPAEPVLIKRNLGGQRSVGALPRADAGLNYLEVAFGRDVPTAPDGSLPGAKTMIGAANATSTLVTWATITEPGRYAVVARPLSTTSFGPGIEPHAPGPWTAPATFTAMTRFDLARGTLIDKKGPSYTVKVAVSPPEARGAKVKVALGVCEKGRCDANSPGAFKRFKTIGTKTIGPDGTITFKGLKLKRGVVSGIRLTHPGSALVQAGSAVQGVRVFKASGTANLRFLQDSGVPVPAR